MDDNDILASDIYPPKTKPCKYKEQTKKTKEEKLKEWMKKMKEQTQKMKEWKIKSYPLIKKVYCLWNPPTMN